MTRPNGRNVRDHLSRASTTRRSLHVHHRHRCPHPRHSAATIDEHGRVLGSIEIGAALDELHRLIDWLTGFDGDRLIAVEGAKGLGLALSRRLLEAHETVVDIATHLTAQGRKASRRRGKDDEADAVTVARVALREPDLPRLTLAQLDADLKLLVDARDQLVVEATRVRNRLPPCCW